MAVKRFVTGHNEDGKSTVIMDDFASNVQDFGFISGADIWVTHESPADNSGCKDLSLRPFTHDPSHGGTVFRFLRFPPATEISEGQAKKFFLDIGSKNQPTESDRNAHGLMHKTDSVDYMVVLKGELWMIMEDGEYMLRGGDCVVQRGTKHSWENRSDQECSAVVVLIDAQPVSCPSDLDHMATRMKNQ